jgi:SAM-dependent methyltransferase
VIESKNGITKQKALGQYFTEFILAHLLSNLAYHSQSPQSILDPMCGKGDMLLAAHKVYRHSNSITGVDIDPTVLAKAQKQVANMGNIKIRQGNAFDLKTWQKPGLRQYQLVITNPPYVRYQSQHQIVTKYGLPNAGEVRDGLLAIAQNLPFNDQEEKEFFLRVIKNYSGLADLAVPSWILCGLLTKPGGRLAMVVPEAWLSRDYAAPIQWMLTNYFRLLFVVEDANHSWFKDAQIKTNLIVAQRNSARESLSHNANDYYVFASLDNSNSNESVVKHLYPQAGDPDHRFSIDMETILKKGKSVVSTIPFRFELRELNRDRANAWTRLQKTKRISKVVTIGAESPSHDQIVLPQLLHDLLGEKSSRLVTLSALGVGVGQGLRTGANNFFYLKLANTITNEGEMCLIASEEMKGMKIKVTQGLTLPALRYQSELPKFKRAIDESAILERVICLFGYGLPEDIQNLSNSLLLKLQPIPQDLAEYVRQATTTPARNGTDKLIPQMSAVITNASASRGSFWYCLPPLTDRHRPDIIIPRVNSQPPSAWLNPDRKIVIDANFSTIWLTPKTNSSLDVWSLLAILNSTWAQTVMELSGSVMGGGALKLEASHLRQFPLPDLGTDSLKRLSKIGKLIAIGDLKAIDEGNSIMIGGIGIRESQECFIDKLSQITSTHFMNRHNKSRKQP